MEDIYDEYKNQTNPQQIFLHSFHQIAPLLPPILHNLLTAF